MNLSFTAEPSGFLKIDKDGDTVLTIKPGDGLDLNKIAYFHRRPDTQLHILGKGKDLNCTGYIQEISVKSEVTLKFMVMDEKIDLNLVHALCKDPETWNVRIYDAQTEISEFQKAEEKLRQQMTLGAAAKGKLEEAKQALLDQKEES